MLKNILNLGTTLNKSEQKSILGGLELDWNLGDPTIKPCVESVCFEDINTLCNHTCCSYLVTLEICGN